MRQTAVVICPGRGTYTKSELGYLSRPRPAAQAQVHDLVQGLDQRLAALGQPTVSQLDGAAAFSLKTHTPGEYASTLIYACSAADFLSINRDRFDIVAVTGNSMGWYTALALAGALVPGGDFTLIHTMGSMMRGGVVGGQLIYPLVDDAWRRDPAKVAVLEQALGELRDLGPGHEAYLSIRFGGYAIIGGTEPALARLMGRLPPVEGRYPFILVNHAAFHTPLLAEASRRGFASLGSELFQAPQLPLIDGRGAIWQPYATDPDRLRDYTLGHQVTEPYDFSAAIGVALKEFAPDCLILLGPGATSGGAVGQVLVDERWQGITGKADFAARQEQRPLLLAMGRDDQGALVRA